MPYDDFNYGHNLCQWCGKPHEGGPEKCDNGIPTYEQSCMGLMVCPHCGKAVSCSDITTTGEEINMIPRGNRSSGNSGNNNRKRGSGFRYLSADMLSSTHQLATIIEAKLMPDNFRRGQDSIVCKLKFKGEYILWTLREGNPALETIGDAVGDDETTWKNIDLELFLEEDNFSGVKRIRCEVVATVQPSQPGKRGK